MESWQSLVYCIGLENRRTEMFREFKSHTFLQSHDTLGYAHVSPNGFLKGLSFGWHTSSTTGNSYGVRIIFSSCWVGVKSQPIGCTHSLIVKQIDDGSNPSVCSRLKSSSYQMLVGELRHREIWNVSHSATKILS